MSSSTLAFSDTKFDSTSYSAYRPIYGKALYDQLLAFHQGNHSVALDLGCGTGQITETLAHRFDKVYGIDTSAKMLEKATRKDNIEYRVGTAEATTLRDKSVDLVTVGQAAHWFQHDAWFTEMARILRPQGTLSFWNYNEAVFTDSAEATRLLSSYFRDDDKLGPYWPQPGRRILESAMAGVHPASSLFCDIEWHYTAQCGSTEASPVSKRMPLRLAESYIRTSSAFHNWQSKHSSIVRKNDGGTGDIVDELIAAIKTSESWNDETIVHVHWPTVAVLARKR